jgi:branched-chain amino acid transport system ATP-binding protein
MSTALLRAESISVRFGGLLAVDNASLQVGSGEICGLIGPNGAGKTTFFNAVSGLVPITSGEIELDGTRINTLAAHVRAKLGLRRTFQSVQLAQELTVLENVAIGLHTQIRENIFTTIFEPRERKLADYAAQEKIYEVLEELHVGDLALRPVKTLSFAQQRYVEIARALAPAPKVLMLDEPAAGLTPAEIVNLDRLLVRLARKSGIAILLVEHVMDLVLNVCDRVFVFESGRLIASGCPAEIAGHPRVRAAYLGDEYAEG